MSNKANEEYDVLSLTSSVKAKKETPKGVKLVVIVVGVAVILGVFGYSLTQWFKPTDFTSTVALSEDISRFSPLSWVEPETELVNELGSWVRTSKTDPYVNETLGCSLLLPTLKGASAEKGSDLEDTELYTRIFNQPSNVNIVTEEDFIPVNDSGQVEVLRTSYDSVDGDKSFITFYRNTIKSETVYLAILECTNLENYELIVKDENIPDLLNIRFEG